MSGPLLTVWPRPQKSVFLRSYMGYLPHRELSYFSCLLLTARNKRPRKGKTKRHKKTLTSISPPLLLYTHARAWGWRHVLPPFRPTQKSTHSTTKTTHTAGDDPPLRLLRVSGSRGVPRNRGRRPTACAQGHHRRTHRTNLIGNYVAPPYPGFAPAPGAA